LCLRYSSFITDYRTDWRGEGREERGLTVIYSGALTDSLAEAHNIDIFLKAS
jgi:hypothetical protein